jgi:hypothetical protein
VKTRWKQLSRISNWHRMVSNFNPLTAMVSIWHPVTVSFETGKVHLNKRSWIKCSSERLTYADFTQRYTIRNMSAVAVESTTFRSIATFIEKMFDVFFQIM